MKISLQSGSGSEPAQTKAAEDRALERTILNAKKGDWESKDVLHKRFSALIISLAEKRSTDQAVVNKLIEAGREGLYTAAAHYKPTVGPGKFRIFALDFIERSMDRVGKRGSFFARLFGKR